MKRIGLTGFSGSGKSSIVNLAKNESVKTADTDEVICQKYGCGYCENTVINDEALFRQAESVVIDDILHSDVEFIAFGGGFNFDHKAYVQTKAAGVKMIYLRTSFEELASRVFDRPLFKKLGIKEYRLLYENRKPLYEKSANFIVDNNKSLDAVWIEVKEIWNSMFQ